MELKTQVCSLELAKKLKELNCKQDSLFYWWDNQKPAVVIKEKSNEKFVYSAFTSAELGEMLPAQTICRKDYINTTKHWVYSVEIADIKTDFIFAENEANARAKMLVYLIENNLLK